MKLLFLYRPRSEYARELEQYVREFKRLYPDKNVELLDVDSIQGEAKARLYDVVEYPAIIVIRDDDSSLVNYWTGQRLPTMNDVISYLNS
ncbi:MAG TPA: hypothetical protein VMR08_02555 [Patescibacteria group bacterium]|nr:hypothetical protein [Patescibacteria group bacterium]